jgi:hypothetical protein
MKSRGTSELDMSTLDWSELGECRSLVLPRLAARDVGSRCERWGGLPRYVLEKTIDDDEWAVPAFEFAILRLPPAGVSFLGDRRF